MDVCQKQLYSVIGVALVDDIHHTTTIQNIEDGVVQNEGGFVLGVTMVSLRRGEKFYLNLKEKYH